MVGDLIVVGVDGSKASVEALRWALDEAQRRSATVRVVHAWSWPYSHCEIGDLAAAAVLEPLTTAAEQVLDSALGSLPSSPAAPPIERLVVQGPPAAQLIEAAADADLLVVGSRGHGGFTGLLLGSVSQQCAQGAPCPVVIVHPERGDRRTRD